MKKFQPTQEQIRCAEVLVTAMAYEQEIRPVVEAYETQILAKHQFHIDKAWVEKGMPDRIILSRKDSILLSDTDSKVFYSECHEARDAAGLKVDKPENCPLLVANSLRIEAENALLKSMESSPNLESLSKAACLSLDVRAKAVDLTLKLLMPFCRDAEGILQSFV